MSDMSLAGRASQSVAFAGESEVSADSFRDMLTSGGTQSFQVVKTGGIGTVTVFVTSPAGDDTGLWRVTRDLESFLVPRWEQAVVARLFGENPRWKLVGLSRGCNFLVDAGRYGSSDTSKDATVAPSRSSGDAAREVVEVVRTAPSSGATSGSEVRHARLATELREMTGLPAASLGRALGVTREQYQRWLRGDPISTIRYGSLVHLHTIAVEVGRKVGGESIVWWRTPDGSGETPEGLLVKRLVDRVHRLVSSLPDAAPVVGGRIVALPAQAPRDLDDADTSEGDDPDEDPWSPYHGGGRPER